MGFLPSRILTQQPQQATPAAFNGRRVEAWHGGISAFGNTPLSRAAGTGIFKPVDGVMQLPGDGTTYFSMGSTITLTAPYTVLVLGKVPSGSDAYFCGDATTTFDWIWGTAASGFRVRANNTTAVFPNPIAGKTSLFSVCCDNKGSGAFRVYQDGVSLGADSNNIGAVPIKIGSIGRGRSDNPAIPANSSVGLVAVIPGVALSAEQVRSLGNNPWQIFNPLPKRIFASTEAGGTNATGSGSISSVSVSHSTGSASSSSTASGSFAIISIANATATASATSNASATASPAAITVTPTNATASGSSVSDGNATAAFQPISISAATAIGIASAVASVGVQSIGITAPNGYADTANHGAASGQFADITVTNVTSSATGSASANASISVISIAAPIGTATGWSFVNAVATGSLPSISIYAPAGSASTVGRIRPIESDYTVVAIESSYNVTNIDPTYWTD